LVDSKPKKESALSVAPIAAPSFGGLTVSGAF
jgi:hypothetical protein